MNNKRPYGKAFATTVQRKPFRPFPQNTTPMVLYRTPSNFASLTNPPYKKTPIEKKNVDFSGSVGQVTVTPNTWSELDILNALPQGVSGGERIGRKIQLRSLLIRWTQSDTAVGKAIRILVIYDKQGDGSAAPTITQVLAADNFNAPMAMGTSERFVVLVDEYIDPIANGQGVTTTRAGKIYRKLNLPQQFLNAGGAIADISSGAIYLACCVPNVLVAGAGIGYFSRIRYTDV